jgi:hypothetical protein
MARLPAEHRWVPVDGALRKGYRELSGGSLVNPLLHDHPRRP